MSQDAARDKERRRLVSAFTDSVLDLLRLRSLNTSDVEFVAGVFADDLLDRQARTVQKQVDAEEKERADKIEELQRQLGKLYRLVHDSLNDALAALGSSDAEFYVVDGDGVKKVRSSLSKILTEVEACAEGSKDSLQEGDSA